LAPDATNLLNLDRLPAQGPWIGQNEIENTADRPVLASTALEGTAGDETGQREGRAGSDRLDWGQGAPKGKAAPMRAVCAALGFALSLNTAIRTPRTEYHHGQEPTQQKRESPAETLTHRGEAKP